MTIVVCGLFEPLSTAASGSAAMLFGLGVDGTLLLDVAYLTGRRRGQDAEGAVAGLASPAVSLTIGFTTTAATFLGLALLDFPALAGLGRIVGIGILLCGVFTLAMVPALAPPHPTPNQLRRLEARWLPALVSRRRRLIVAAAGLMTVVCAIAAPALRLVPTLDRLKTDTPGEEADARLAQRFGLPADTMIVLATGPDLDALVDAHSRLEGALQDAPAVPVSAVSALLPPRARRRRSRRSRPTRAPRWAHCRTGLRRRPTPPASGRARSTRSPPACPCCSTRRSASRSTATMRTAWRIFWANSCSGAVTSTPR